MRGKVKQRIRMTKLIQWMRETAGGKRAREFNDSSTINPFVRRCCPAQFCLRPALHPGAGRSRRKNLKKIKEIIQ